MAHELVPDFKILSKKDKEKMLEKYDIEEMKLPKVKDTDPVVVAIKAKPGDVLEITRKSITAGTSLYYRLVVSTVPEVFDQDPDFVEEETDDESELETVQKENNENDD